MNRLGLVWVAFAASCAEYEVSLVQVSDPPLPVTLGWEVEMPAGILVTARAHPFRNGGEMSSDAEIGFTVDNPTVLDLSPVIEDDSEFGGVWALAAVAPGTTTIEK